MHHKVKQKSPSEMTVLEHEQYLAEGRYLGHTQTETETDSKTSSRRPSKDCTEESKDDTAVERVAHNNASDTRESAHGN